jgi:hypothetical protein
VNITVDYDGPSLSDTSSLASLEEYKNRNGSQQSFSFGAPSVDLDDDSITVSSRDAISRAEMPIRDGNSQASARSWDLLSQPSNAQAGPSTTLRFQSTASDPFSDDAGKTAANLPEDPAAVFERLKMEESIRDDSSSVQQDNLHENDRGAAWLRDQNARTIRSMLGALPEPSVSSGVTSIPEEDEEEKPLGGALALEQDPRGKYYYSYTSSSASQTRDSGYYDEGANGELQDAFQHQPKPRPSSRHLNWLAAQQAVSPQPTHQPPPPSMDPFQHEDHDSPEDPYSNSSIPRELLQFLPLGPPPSETLTDCSECGVLLDSIRYVCSICGEKKPASQSSKGKGRSVLSAHDHSSHGFLGYQGLAPGHFHDHHDQHGHQYPSGQFQNHHEHEYSYPPRPFHHDTSASSSRTFLGGGSTESLTGSMRHSKPLPRIPVHPGPSGPPLSVFGSQTTLVPPGHARDDPGYELCSGCLEQAGVTHAIEAGLPPGSSSPNVSPSSPEDAQRALEWRRLAPKKGQTRHAYHEKVWGHLGWEDVGACSPVSSDFHRAYFSVVLEQDENQIHECSTCAAVTTHHRYKCASCKKFNQCRACYRSVQYSLHMYGHCQRPHSQVHDLHPSHAFLVVPDLPVQSNGDSDYFETVPPDLGPEGEKCMLLSSPYPCMPNISFLFSLNPPRGPMCPVSSIVQVLID